jgi:hypothetical protein
MTAWPLAMIRLSTLALKLISASFKLWRNVTGSPGRSGLMNFAALI